MRVQRLRVENTTKFSIIFVAKTLVKKFIEIAKAKKMNNGYMSVFRQPRIHTGQYLDKCCFNQSESRQRRNY